MNKKRILELKNKYRYIIYAVLIIALSFYLRTFNINWDNNYYFHPDERAIIMYADPLTLPQNFKEFFSADSPLNPHFFAYGNFPLYLVKGLGTILSPFNDSFAHYGGMHIVGRLVSALSDTATVLMVFMLGLTLFSKRVGLFASFLYGASVFPIQTSHFFAVDTMLTFFMTATIFSLILFAKKPSYKKSATIGVSFGFALATKVSAAIMLPVIVIVFLSIALSKGNRKKIWHLIKQSALLIATVFFVFVTTQPYALIDFSNFLHQTLIQSQMSKDPFVFPYTLQYVGKLPYIYELKNIMLFGQGPIIFISCVAGVVLFLAKYRKGWKNHSATYLFLFYGIFYFIVFGSFAVGWMRYMLPLYPFLAIFGGFLLAFAVEKIPKALIKNYFLRKTLLTFFIVIILIYPISFLSIYTHTNTRIQASEWINDTIPHGSSLAVEHWDDALPVFGGYNYVQYTLPLYEPDTDTKWVNIENILKNTNYIIIASNRLYTPLQKLTDCKNLPLGKCYPLTSRYYEELFSEKHGFKLVAEFSEYPTIPLFNIKINDQGADESFTVYDHPKILIFKNEKF